MGWEYNLMMAIQSLSTLGEGLVDTIFAVFTFFGEESFLLVAVFAIYWCIDKKLGEHLLLSLFTSISINGLLKDVVRRPRPFLTDGWEDIRHVKINNVMVDTATLGDSFSFPSGHSQCAGGFFTTLARWGKKRWLYIVAGTMVPAVMLSRVYLGVHFPTDVFMGAILGIASSLICYMLLDRFYKYKVWIFAAVVLISLQAVFIAPSPDTVKAIGVGIGAVVGLLWEVKAIAFSVDGTAMHRIWRLIMGAIVVMTLRMGLKMIFPEQLIYDGVRYAFVGFAATGLVPWIFTRYKL